MKLILATPRGFCAGVHRAVNTLSQILDLTGEPIYVYHEIVHNSYIVDAFRRRGVRFVESLSDVPEHAILLFSAHGVSPNLRKEAAQRHLRTVDATCPLVQRIHRLAQKYAEQNVRILFLGHAGHDEVVGTLGEAPDHISLISSMDDLERLPLFSSEKITYLTQTTLSKKASDQMIDKIRERFGDQLIESGNAGICFATQNRQNAVRELAPLCDVGLIIGSANSSNTQRLVELAREIIPRSFLINGPADISREWFQSDSRVFMTAGASAPESIVQECVQWLSQHFLVHIEERVTGEENSSFPPPDLTSIFC